MFLSTKLGIVDVIGQKVVKTEVLKDDYHIVGCKNDYLVLLNKQGNDLVIYKIEKKMNNKIASPLISNLIENDSFEFKQIFREQLQAEYIFIKLNIKVNKCHFNDSKPNRFIITLYDIENDKIKIRFF